MTIVGIYKLTGIEQVEKYLKDHLESEEIKNKNIVLKVNLMGIAHQPSVCTNPFLVKEVVKYLLNNGAKKVTIVDGTFWTNDPSTTRIYHNAKYPEILGNLNIDFIDLNTDKKTFVDISKGKAIKSAGIAKTIVDAEYIINMPVMKTHNITGVSVSLKNMKGVIVKEEKLKSHYTNLHQALVDLNTVVKPNLTIVDGTYAMEGNGPIGGTPKKMDLIIVGRNSVAIDAVCTRIMGFNPLDIPHIKLSHDGGLGPIDLDEIEIIGAQINEVSQSFKAPDLRSVYSTTSQGRFGRINDRLTYYLNKFVKTNKILDIDMKKCEYCMKCIKACPYNVIFKERKNIAIDTESCRMCLICTEVCKPNAIRQMTLINFFNINRFSWKINT